MSKSLQQLKDKQLQEFSVLYKEVFTTELICDHDNRFACEHRFEAVKSFLSSSIELAYEEGREEKLGYKNELKDGGALTKQDLDNGLKYMESLIKPPEKNDWEKKSMNELAVEFGTTNLQQIDAILRRIKTEIRKALDSHRQDILQEIKENVIGLVVINSTGFDTYADGKRLWHLDLDRFEKDLLKELK